MFSHKVGEYRFHMETREKRVIDCFLKSGGCEVTAPGLESGAPSFSSHPSVPKERTGDNSHCQRFNQHRYK